MISIIPTYETTAEISCPLAESATATVERREEYSIEVHRRRTVKGEFDLFAEARQIYLRARSQKRIRSSNII